MASDDTVTAGVSPSATADDGPSLVSVRGDRLGSYRIDEGVSGQTTFLAFDPNLGRDVVIELIEARDQAALKELTEAARGAAAVNHPNTTAVYEMGIERGRAFVVHEHVEGPSVDAWLESQPRGWREIVEVFAQAGRGLAALHARDLVHGDPTSTNIIVAPDRVRLTGMSGRGRTTDAADDRRALCEALASALEGATDRDAIPRSITAAVEHGRAHPDEVSAAELVGKLVNEPSRRRLGLVLGLASVAAAASLLFVVTRGSAKDDTRCSSAGSVFDEVWTPATRGALEKALLAHATSAPKETFELVSKDLDRYRDVWAIGAERVCRDPDPRKDRCLARQLRRVRAVLDQLVTANRRAALRATIAVRRVTRETCANSRRLPSSEPPSSEELRVRLDSIDAEDAAVEAAIAIGKAKDVDARSAALVASARTIDQPAALVSALAHRAEVLSQLRRDEERLEVLREAVKVSAAAGYDYGVARAWAGIMEVVGSRMRKPNEALSHRPAAEAALARAGDVPVLAARYHNSLGNIYRTKGDLAKAIDHMKKSVALARASLGDRDPNLAASLNNLGVSYRRAKRHAEAIDALVEARAIYRASHGAGHPVLAAIVGNLALLYLDTNALDKAEAALRDSRKLARSFLPADHPSHAINHINTAWLYRKQRRFADAERELDRALAIYLARFGARSVQRAEMYLYRARLERDRGRSKAELKLCTAARDRLRALEKTSSRLYQRASACVREHQAGGGPKGPR